MKKSNIFYGWWVVLGSAILLAVLGPAAVAVANIYQTPIVAQYGITNSQFAISNSLLLGLESFSHLSYRRGCPVRTSSVIILSA